MNAWSQEYLPIGGLLWSSVFAVIPIVSFFTLLAVFKLRGYVASGITLALSIGIAAFVFHMPVDRVTAAALFGFTYGLWPIAWIIVTAVFLFKVVVRSGQFDVIRGSIISLTDDRRLQVLLIGFSFGAFLEGAAGFGAPVAITSALLVGLGFNPLYAAGLCLIADTAPVAFGGLGIPIFVAGQVSGHDPAAIAAMAGRQLPFLSFLIPFWLVFIMDGVKGVKETWPAALVTGGSFAITQFLTSNYLGPELPDVASALVSLVSLTAFLNVWQPKTVRSAATTTGAVGGGAVLSAHSPFTGSRVGRVGARNTSRYSSLQICKAWSPFVILTACVSLWSYGPFKSLFQTGHTLNRTTFVFHIPHLDLLTQRVAPIVSHPVKVPAVLSIDTIGATGTAIFVAALLSMLFLKLPLREGAKAFAATLKELRAPIFSIGLVLAFAFVENFSGMSSTLALLLAQTGAAFPFFSAFLGWIGVFLTGSDTSSNALFCSLQAATAQQIGVPGNLLVAANTTGGVAGKMISPQSIAIACAATGLVGRESELLRFTLRRSVALVTVIGAITFIQAYWLSWMIP
ncbi:lactate permease [Paraburkholderia sp. GAS199]|uniref:lactate permease LctP family transporter n=1 Tax=Paraburkholderia sp. GAS199 TaxID=3035126 RepID=UPI003D1B503D